MARILGVIARRSLQVEARFSSRHDPVTSSCIAPTNELGLNVTAMRSLRIGEVARAANVAPSAIRYYEKCGLLPKPARQSRQRRYDRETIGYLEIIAIARKAGMTIAEIRELVSGFAPGTKPRIRWQTIAARKRRELETLEARIRSMRVELDTNFRCECPTLDDCARGLSDKRGRARCA
jgi:MerR family transcriptional regulator, redox-sensitive transcriptional activator SoxR